uniref:AAA+ ATPase domain-containing protein n=1 Tax=Meloidogyne hapla TaxID=6305 RepID=A0A1I8B278_MELHA
MGMKRRKHISKRITGLEEKIHKNDNNSIQTGNHQQNKISGKEQYIAEKSNIKLEDVGGCEAQFLEAIYMLMHLKQPELCTNLGVSPPKGLLLHGPPGCGKSLFARAISGELQIPILSISSTELIAGISGDSERRIRQLFVDAESANTQTLILIEDIDVIAAKRENAQREMERRIVTQLIASLDDLGSRVFVIGTTNRPEVLDASLRRAGRFDKEIAIGIPDCHSRIEILKIATRKMSLAEDVDLKRLAHLTPGYVGADLFALVREASTRALSCAFSKQTSNNDEGDKKQNLISSNIPKKRTLEEIREEIFRACNWFREPLNNPLVFDKNELTISMNNFEWALSTVHPSAKREGFATVPDVTWEDIGSLEQIRSELNWSILYPIQRPEYFEHFGLDARPQGILLCGPPGCGKTMLAKAVANETGMSFISIKGPELMSMYVGESERAVRTVFQRARDSAPCVIFFDEIDSLCPKRSQKETVGSARLVNQLLTEMDGLEARKDVFLIGATNRPDIIDPAILRPGRFDKIIFVDFPSAKDRADILYTITKNKTRPRICSSVSFEQMAEDQSMEFFTGADLVALVHEATLMALKGRIECKNLSVDSVTSTNFEKALRKVSPSVKFEDRLYYKKLREKFSVEKIKE